MKQMNVFKYIPILVLFALGSCEEVTFDQTFTIGQESSFRMNQLYTSSDGQYTFRINEINDSRCPEGVQCGWEGEASLKGEWTANNNKTEIELHSVAKAQEKQPEGFNIQIIDAKPYPKFGTESKPEDLVITLKIQKTSKLDAFSFPYSMKSWDLYSWLNGDIQS